MNIYLNHKYCQKGVQVMKKLWKKIGVQEASERQANGSEFQNHMGKIPEMKNLTYQQKDDLDEELNGFSFSQMPAIEEMDYDDLCQNESSITVNNKTNTFIFEENQKIIDLQENEKKPLESCSPILPTSRTLKETTSRRKNNAILNLLKISISTLKFHIEAIQKDITEEKIKMKETISGLTNLYINLVKSSLQKQKEHLQKESAKTIQHLQEINQDLIQKVTELEKANDQQLSSYSLKVREKQIINEKLLNDLSKSKSKHESAINEVNSLKTENYALNQKVFDLQQKIKGIDLEVEKKFNLFIQEYQGNFMAKNAELHKNINSLQIELKSSKDFQPKRIATESTNNEVETKRKFHTHRYKKSELDPIQDSTHQCRFSQEISQTPKSNRICQLGSSEQLKPRKTFNLKTTGMDKVSSVASSVYIENPNQCLDEKLEKIKKEIKKEIKELKKL